MNDARTGFFDSLIAAARENPLSAALVGGGALWLLIGEEKLKGAARSAVSAASDAVDSGSSALRATATSARRTATPSAAPEWDHEASIGAGESLRSAGAAATEAISETFDGVSDRFNGGATLARDQLSKLGDAFPAGETLTKARSSLGDMLERQPLVLGAVGLAIGATIAGAFRTSDLESQYVGEIGANLKDEVSSRGTAVSKALREASDSVMAEVGDTGAEAVDRLKQAGTDAAQAAMDLMK